MRKIKQSQRTSSIRPEYISETSAVGADLDFQRRMPLQDRIRLDGEVVDVLRNHRARRRFARLIEPHPRRFPQS
jgi:hypothetical protein